LILHMVSPSMFLLAIHVLHIRCHMEQSGIVLRSSPSKKQGSLSSEPGTTQGQVLW